LKQCDNREKIYERVEELIRKMTVGEKVGQLNQKLYGFNCYEKNGENIEISQEFKEEVEKNGGIGVLYGLFRADPWSGKTYKNGIYGKIAAKTYNKFQHYVIENSRLKIPMLMSSECPHGHQALDGYLLPVNLAIGCTFNPELVKRAYGICAKQMKEIGVHMSLMSVLDVLRDPRWGRSEECYGEDPYLSTQMAKAAITGCQYDENGNLRMIAVAKHFCAQGECTGGLNGSPASIGERELREIHLPAIRELCKVGVKACMAAYNEVDGIPCHANGRLINDILRNEFGFNGAVMADGGAVDRLIYQTGDVMKAGALSLKAGVDISLWDDGFTYLEKAYEEGYITIDDLDNAVRRVLNLKFELGLFDNPYVNEENVMSYSYENYSESLELARESVVLLKNKNDILPINLKSIKRIAIIGPNGDNIYNQMGDYTPTLHKGIGKSLYEGISGITGEGIEVVYIKGCNIRGQDLDEISVATQIAKQSDVIILALGGSSTRNFDLKFDTNGEVITTKPPTDMDCGEGADVANMNLGGLQNKLAKAIFKLDKPVITVLIQGRPHSVQEIKDETTGLLCAFYGGAMSGQAIAEIIFGKITPSGRLAVSIPRYSGQIPVYYNHKFKGQRPNGDYKYVDIKPQPLYAFGDGLSYTSFQYKNARVNKEIVTMKELEQGDKVEVSFEIENTSTNYGCAVPQLYIFDMEATITRRIKELKGFKKIWLKPGQTKTCTISLIKEDFSIWDWKMEFVVEVGKIELMICDSGHLYYKEIIEII